jgi:hypothetical protein
VDPLGRSFSCVLANGSKIDAKKLLAMAILDGLPSSPLSETKDKFEITWFEITGDPVTKSYSLDIVTDFDWGFDLGTDTRLAIKQISLSLEYTKERSSEGEQLCFELGGSLAIGDVTISVGAKYDSAHWTVSGAAYDIRLNEILNLLPNVEKLKSVLPEIELPFVKLEVTPSTGAFKFDAVCEINWSSRPLGIDGQFSGDIALHLARASGKPLTYDILFRGTGQLADPALAATLNVQIQKADESEQLVTFGGTLAIKNEDVTLDTDLTFKGNVVVGADEKTIILAFKPEKNLAVTDVLGKLLPGDLPAPSIGIGLKDALFAYRKSAVVGATLKLDLSLGKMLPEALKALLGEPEIGVDNLRVLYTMTTLAKADLENLNAHIVALALAPLPSVADPDTKQIELHEGFQASGSLKFGGQKPTPLMLPMAAPKLDGAGPASVPAASKAEPKPETSEAKWIDIGKSLGPLRIGRVGGQYSSGKIGLLLDAAVDLAGLHIGLSGFALHIPLREGEAPSIGLDGLDLAYAGGPIEVAGALLRRHIEGQPDSYDGLALIKAPTFSGVPAARNSGRLRLQSPPDPPADRICARIPACARGDRRIVPEIPRRRGWRAGGQGRANTGADRPETFGQLHSADARRVLARRRDQVQFVRDDHRRRSGIGVVWPRRRDRAARARPDEPAARGAEGPGTRLRRTRATVLDQAGRGNGDRRRTVDRRLVHSLEGLPAHRRVRLLLLVLR